MCRLSCMHLTVRLKTGCDRESERASEHREAVKRRDLCCRAPWAAAIQTKLALWQSCWERSFTRGPALSVPLCPSGLSRQHAGDGVSVADSNGACDTHRLRTLASISFSDSSSFLPILSWRRPAVLPLSPPRSFCFQCVRLPYLSLSLSLSPPPLWFAAFLLNRC